LSDEPTNGELAWRLERISDMLAGVVGRPEYTADKRGIDHRLNDFDLRLSEERRERERAVKELGDRITAQAQAGIEHRMHWRTLLWTGLLPAVVAAIGVVAAIWINHGGHPLCRTPWCTSPSRPLSPW
jgi:hypothetical protein